MRDRGTSNAGLPGPGSGFMGRKCPRSQLPPRWGVLRVRPAVEGVHRHSLFAEVVEDLGHDGKAVSPRNRLALFVSADRFGANEPHTRAVIVHLHTELAQVQSGLESKSPQCRAANRSCSCWHNAHLSAATVTQNRPPVKPFFHLFSLDSGTPFAYTPQHDNPRRPSPPTTSASAHRRESGPFSPRPLLRSRNEQVPRGFPSGWGAMMAEHLADFSVLRGLAALAIAVGGCFAVGAIVSATLKRRAKRALGHQEKITLWAPAEEPTTITHHTTPEGEEQLARLAEAFGTVPYREQ